MNSTQGQVCPETWTHLFSNKWSSFHGSTPDLDVAYEIIREYEIATVSKFWVWKVARNFGSTGMFSFVLSFKVSVLPLSRVIRHQLLNKYYRLSVPEQYMGSGYLSPVKNCIFFIDLCEECFVI